MKANENVSLIVPQNLLKDAYDILRNPYNEKKEEKVIKKKFYGNDDVTTVCLLLGSLGTTARGISICSEDEEEFDKEEGQKHAENAALRAFKGRKPEKFIHPKVIKALTERRIPYTYKSYRNPELSYFERKLLKLDK